MSEILSGGTGFSSEFHASPIHASPIHANVATSTGKASVTLSMADRAYLKLLDPPGAGYQVFFRMSYQA